MIQLYQGDCLELMSDIPDGSIDMILCDLPYGTTQNKWDNKLPLDALWAQYERIIKTNGAIVLFSQMPFAAELVSSNPKLFRYEWIWQKSQGTGFLNANRMPLKAHENILVFYKRLPVYHPQKIPGKPYTRPPSANTGSYGKFLPVDTVNEDGSRYPLDVIAFQTCNGSKDRPVHPTQKPVLLLEYLIRTYTDEGDTVLDNCMGVGSTGVACVNTARHFIGIELVEDYFQIARQRIDETIGQLK